MKVKNIDQKVDYLQDLINISNSKIADGFVALDEYVQKTEKRLQLMELSRAKADNELLKKNAVKQLLEENYLGSKFIELVESCSNTNMEEAIKIALDETNKRVLQLEKSNEKLDIGLQLAEKNNLLNTDRIQVLDNRMEELENPPDSGLVLLSK